jgi:hypothetical protein
LQEFKEEKVGVDDPPGTANPLPLLRRIFA